MAKNLASFHLTRVFNFHKTHFFRSKSSFKRLGNFTFKKQNSFALEQLVVASFEKGSFFPWREGCGEITSRKLLLLQVQLHSS